MKRLALAVAAASAFALPAQPASALCDGPCETIRCLVSGRCVHVPPPPYVGCFATPDVKFCL